MARYYFDTTDCNHDPDVEGTDLPDDGAARKHGIVFAGEVMNSDPSVLWDGRDFNVQVSNANHLLLFVITAFATNAPAGGNTK